MARLKLTRQTIDDKRQCAPIIYVINICIHHYLNLDIYMYMYTHINICIYIHSKLWRAFN